LEFEADRAWQFYEQGAALLPLIEPDSRAALWALVRTYSGLLARIGARGYDVFSSRVRLTAGEKTGILLRAGLGLCSERNALEKRDCNRRRAGGSVLRGRAD